MVNKLTLLALVAIASVSCSHVSPLARFSALEELNSIPFCVDSLVAEPDQVEAAINLRAPGLKGRADGIIRHAGNGKYLVELYGRNELFLKVYFLDRQTLIWPAAGMPKVFAREDAPTLDAVVHSRLPKWRLEDVLPVPVSGTNAGEESWRSSGSTSDATERILREKCDPLFKRFKRSGGTPGFPYRTVELCSEAGYSKVVWKLRPMKSN
ncbi:MAG: hypothetical protein H6506_04990 [Calditrichaeota bacterium]|nr:hypothetical protein [Calditrichota bacterium]MCB9366379.1 hypothetical protein [Calditrichota bacterium]MCB9391991.1 hypothetical protein [Calditrichota bacterium]